MKETTLSSLSYPQQYISRHWAFIVYTLFVPISLNLIAILIEEIKFQRISDYYQAHKLMGVKPTIFWPVLISELSIALTFIALSGYIAKVLLNKIHIKVNHRSLRLGLSIFIIGIAGFAYSLGTCIIDLVWSMTIFLGPGFGLPRSSLYRINSIISFLVITIIFMIYLWSLNNVHVNDDQPNPRSTRPL